MDCNVTNHFLIATPVVTDLEFVRSVIYVCQHDEEGAMGVIINHPTEERLSNLMSQVKVVNNVAQNNAVPIMFGGPDHRDLCFILHTPLGFWRTSMAINDEIAVTTSLDILTAMANGVGPERKLIIVGHVRWAPGQLEKQLKDNYWLSTPANLEIMLDVPFKKRREEVMKLMGMDADAFIAGYVGHA